MSIITECNDRLDGQLKSYAATWAMGAVVSSVTIALLLDRLPGPLRLAQPFNKKVFYIGTAVGFTLLTGCLALGGPAFWFSHRIIDFTCPVCAGARIALAGLEGAGLLAATSNRSLFAGVGAFFIGLQVSSVFELMLSPTYLIWTRNAPPLELN